MLSAEVAGLSGTFNVGYSLEIAIPSLTPERFVAFYLRLCYNMSHIQSELNSDICPAMA